MFCIAVATATLLQWHLSRGSVWAQARVIVDAATVVARAQARGPWRRVRPPSGYHLGWGGQYENLARARLRLSLVLPALCARFAGSWQRALPRDATGALVPTASH